MHFFTKKFGQFKKKQYFCMLFRKKNDLRNADENMFDIGKEIKSQLVVI